QPLAGQRANQRPGFFPGQLPLPGLPGEPPGGTGPHSGGGPERGVRRPAAPGAPSGGGAPPDTPRPGFGRQRPPGQGRGALSRSGPDLRPPAGGPAPGLGATLRRGSRVPGDLAARPAAGGRGLTPGVVPDPLGIGDPLAS